MYQAAYSTHLDLSNLADTKASVMISLNGITITIRAAYIVFMLGLVVGVTVLLVILASGLLTP